MKAATIIAGALLVLAFATDLAAAVLPGGLPIPVEGPSETRRPYPLASVVVEDDGSVVADWAGIKSCTLIEPGGVPDGWTLPETAPVTVHDRQDWAELDHTVLHWRCQLV